MTPLFENRDLAATVSEKLKVFAQPQRLMILSCLYRGEHSVAEIGAMTGIGQPALSQQLAELRRAGLVSPRRQSKQIWYALADDGVRRCVQTMEAMLTAPVRRPPQRLSSRAWRPGRRTQVSLASRKS